MKLLTQSDDYGFTRGVTCGILDVIGKGTRLLQADADACTSCDHPEYDHGGREH